MQLLRRYFLVFSIAISKMRVAMLAVGNEGTAFGCTVLSLWMGGKWVYLPKAPENQQRERRHSGWRGPASATYSCGHGFLSHYLQGVDHWDVAKPPGNGQGSVPILARGKGGQGIKKSFPVSWWLCVPTRFIHTKQRVSVSLVPPTVLHKTLLH